MKSQTEKVKYVHMSYDYKGRFVSYWHQINEVLKINPENIIEIGIGNGFVSNYLRKYRQNVTTMDIDMNLQPDIVATCNALPFQSNSFDVVACYEVLEHLPFEYFNIALAEIYRVSKTYALLSLPDSKRFIRISIRIPRLGELRKIIEVPTFKRGEGGEHYWEIGLVGYPLTRIRKIMQMTGFDIVKTYRVFENPYHRFFILKK